MNFFSTAAVFTTPGGIVNGLPSREYEFCRNFRNRSLEYSPFRDGRSAAMALYAERNGIELGPPGFEPGTKGL